MQFIEAVRRLRPHRKRTVLRVMCQAHQRPVDTDTLDAIDVLRSETTVGTTRLADTTIADLSMQAIKAWKARTIADLTMEAEA